MAGTITVDSLAFKRGYIDAELGRPADDLSEAYLSGYFKARSLRRPYTQASEPPLHRQLPWWLEEQHPDFL